jgi:hypothetical protein
MATTILNTTMPDLFAQTIPPQKRTRKRKTSGKTVNRQLNEVIYGQRPFLQVYSNTLQRLVCFVNEGLMNPDDLNFDGKIITMEMLAEIITNESTIL